MSSTSVLDKRQEENLRRAQQEVHRLEQSLGNIQTALSTAEAAEERIVFIEKTPEPLDNSNEHWRDVEGCCNIT
jgi:hypothetical protein